MKLMKALWVGILAVSTTFSADDDFQRGPNFDLKVAMQSVGYMFFKFDNALSFCNLALIGDRYAITNNHCMPNEAACKSAQIFFTSDGEHVSGTYSCTKLLKTVDNKVKGQYFSDFSIFELNDTAGIYHGYFPLAKSIPSDEFKIWRLKYDPSGYVKSNITANYTRCMAKRSVSKDGEKFLQIKSIHQGETCHLMFGNSGGGLLNDNGELIGVVNSGDPKKDQSDLGLKMNEWIPDYIGGILLDTIESHFPQLRTLNQGW